MATTPARELPPTGLRPARVCAALLAALEAAEGRRRMRKRDQTPDGIGLSAKRILLERAVREDPEPEAFEGWLLERAAACEGDPGGAAFGAMARSIFEEWRLAHAMPDFSAWLERGAPSEDSTPFACGARDTRADSAADSSAAGIARTPQGE